MPTGVLSYTGGGNYTSPPVGYILGQPVSLTGGGSVGGSAPGLSEELLNLGASVSVNGKNAVTFNGEYGTLNGQRMAGVRLKVSLNKSCHVQLEYDYLNPIRVESQQQQVFYVVVGYNF